MYRYLLMLLVILPVFAKGQMYNDPFLNIAIDTNDHSKILEFGGKYNLGSNALTNRQINSLFVPGFISDDLKNSALPDLKSKKNDLGVILNGNLFYCWQPAYKHLHYFINISSQIQYTALFNSDAYKLVMFGNDIFAGKTADFGDLNFKHYAYQSFQFGFYKIVSKKSDNLLLFGGGISLVSGSGYNNLSISKGTLYTSPSGDSLSLNADIASKSVKSNNLFTDINGIGVSVNSFIALKFARTNELRLQLTDLGLIDWFKNIGNININRQFNYTGEDVYIINGKASYTEYYKTLDTIANQAGHPANGKSFISSLPFQIRLLYSKEISSTVYLSGGVEYINNNMQVPELDFLCRKDFSNKIFSCWAGFSLFGYSNYGISAGIEYHICRNFSISVSSQHLDGIVFTNEPLGQGYAANLKLKL